MIGSEKVRAARKKAHLARLKAKEGAVKKGGAKKYGEFYASQPGQMAKAAVNEEIRLAKVAVKDAEESVLIAEVEGGLKAAQENLTIKRLVVQKYVDAAKPRETISLTVAGGG